MAVDSARAKSLFLAASDLADAAERAAYLERECGGDVELRSRVEALLRANDAAPLPPAEAGDGTSVHVPQRLPQTEDHGDPTARIGSILAGKYKLIEEIGEGGMGSVYMAQQTEPVKRAVAVKVIKAGMDSKAVLVRFEAERQALAMMDHLNIARVLDAGTTDGGRPFFVMELVKGVTITQFCDERKLTPRQRLELFVPVCQAIQHAHQKGVIHRDIKPSNVLVAMYDDRPVPKVIDFGVAKAAGQTLTDKTLMTGFGAVVGTPEYMSPEQANLNNMDIDTRSDVYSLGVLLYELLTGTTPVDRKSLGKAALLEILRIVREVEAPKPSAKLSTSDALPSVAACRGTEPAKLSRLMKGELDWVVLKALEKDRARRYDTANGLARDIQRYLADEVVEARPPSAGYRLRKFVRRHKGQVLAATLVLLALLAGMVGTTLGLLEARKQAGIAREEAEKKTQALDEEARQRALAEAEKAKAEQAEAATLADYRASTDDAIEQLIGSKPELGPRERTYLEKTLKRWQAFAARQGEDQRSQAIRAEGHFRVADLWQKLGRRDEARREFETARDLHKKLADAFPAVPKYQQDLAHTHNNLGILLADLGRRDEARREYEAARDLRKKLADVFPVVPDYRQELAHTHNNLGNLLANLGQRDEARKEYETARDLLKKLADAFPALPKYQQDLAGTHNNLGNLLAGMGKRDAARTEFETARDLRIKLATAFPAVPQYKQELAGTHNNLGNMLANLDQRDAARTEFQTARDLSKKLAAAFPAVLEFQQNLARTHNSLGTLLAGLGQHHEARREYEAAQNLLKKLADAFPAVPAYRQELAATHHNLGLLLAGLGQRDEARKEYEAARDLQKKLADAFPAVPEYQQDLARTHNNLGILLAGLGRRDEARREYETSRDLHKKLADAFPAVPEYQVSLGGSYCNFGLLVKGEGKLADSLPWYDLAIRTLTQVLEKEPRDVTARLFLRNSHWGRAESLDQLKKHAVAVKDWDRAIALSPRAERPSVRARRAASRVQAGQVAEAVAEVAELTKSSRWNAGQWYDFACVYALASGKSADNKQAYADRAMELLQKAVKAGFKDAAHMKKDPDLDPLRGRDDFKKLLEALDK